MKDVATETLQTWFDAFQDTITKYNIKPENIYNMDESGFSIGKIEASRIIINSTICQRYQANPGRQEWVSVVECICLDGTAIPPLVIFKGKDLLNTWIPADLHKDWKLSCNIKGWTSNIHGLEWLRRCFEPMTAGKANGEWRALICDGHESHITGDFIGHCVRNKIALLCLPPHSSHLTQPLDVAVFGPLKRHMTSELHGIIQTEISRVQKVEWLSAYVQARNKAFSPSNIKSAFRGAGLYPFNPRKVLNRVPQLPIRVAPVPRSTTPEMPAALDNPALTSSPVDMNIYRAANQELKRVALETEGLPTPARRHVDRLTKSVEKLYTRNTILQREHDALKEVVSSRKKRLSGKRAVIKGKHLLSTPEIHSQVVEEEKASRKRRRISDDSAIDPSLTVEQESENEADETVNRIYDCIVVE